MRRWTFFLGLFKKYKKSFADKKKTCTFATAFREMLLRN